MAIFDVYLDIPEDYLKTIQDVYKFSIILIVFQILVHYSFPGKNIFHSAFIGQPVNDEFSCLLIFILIGIAFYHLVAEKVLKFY